MSDDGFYDSEFARYFGEHLGRGLEAMRDARITVPMAADVDVAALREELAALDSDRHDDDVA
jgi:hypothetical protein